MKQSANTYSQNNERRLEGLIDRLPNGIQPATRWLRRPSSRWIRIPASLLLVGGGLLGFLPFLGFWMLPLGLALLAEDLPPLRRARDRILDRIERHRPLWFARAETAVGTPGVQSSCRSTSSAGS